MAKYEVMALRVDGETRDRLATLAQRLDVPKTVLARRMLERQVQETWSLLGDEETDGR